MSEGQGSIVVSGDYKADAYKLVQILSRFEFSDCGEKPFVNKKQKIMFPPNLDFPHASPQITAFLDELGHEMSGDQLREGIEPSEFLAKDIDLETISEEIAPHIVDGIFELSAVWCGRHLVCHFSNLKIYASGKVELIQITKSVDQNFHEYEVYEKP